MSETLEQIAARLAAQAEAMRLSTPWMIVSLIADALRAAQASGRAETEARKDERLYPTASPLSKSLRQIAKGNRLSSLQVPVLEDAADHIEDVEDKLRAVAQGSAEGRYTAWLMERPDPAGGLPQYWNGFHADAFTKDPWQAIQFARKTDALTAGHKILYAPFGWTLVEHAFTTEAESADTSEPNVLAANRTVRSEGGHVADVEKTPMGIAEGRAAWQPMAAIEAEILKAAAKFPDWPVRGTDAVAIVAEECGELQQAVLQATYEGGSIDAVRKEGVQTAAMAIQFLLNLPDTTFDRGVQVPKLLPSPPAMEPEK